MLKCLLVEHDPIIAADIYIMLDDNGYQVEESHGDINAVCTQIDGASFDIAAMDVNFMGESIFPIASKLARQGIPIIYVTSSNINDPKYSNLPRGDLLSKPFIESDFLSLLAKNLDSQLVEPERVS